MSDDVPQGATSANEGDGREAEEVDVGAAQGDDEAPEPDDGGEADLGDDEGEGEAGQTRQVAEPPSRPRASGRVDRLYSENRELRSKVQDFERQLNQLVQQQRQPTQAELAAQERAEAEAVSMMAPAEVAKYYSQKSESRIAAELNQTRQMLWDQNDAAQYDQLVTQNPTYGRYADKVEELRRQAPGVSRKILLATAIGMRAMEGAPAARTRAQNRSEAQAQRQQARPSQARGDVAAPQERSSGNRWERLRDVQI